MHVVTSAAEAYRLVLTGVSSWQTGNVLARDTVPLVALHKVVGFEEPRAGAVHLGDLLFRWVPGHLAQIRDHRPDALRVESHRREGRPRLPS